MLTNKTDINSKSILRLKWLTKLLFSSLRKKSLDQDVEQSM